GAASTAITSAPFERSSRAAATPLRPSPITTARLPWTCIASPELEGCERYECQKDADDPEPDDDLRLGPPLLFVVVVDRRHQEHAAPGELEGDDLRDDADGLDEEDAAEQDREDLVLRADGAHPEAAAQRERAHVAHEELRWVGVVPKEP